MKNCVFVDLKYVNSKVWEFEKALKHFKLNLTSVDMKDVIYIGF